MVERRAFLYGLGAAIGGTLLSGSPLLAQARAGWRDRLQHDLAALEKQHGGRLGVAVIDTRTGRRAAYRGNERFAMCSTFKMLAAAAILARVDAGKDQLDRRIRFDASAVIGGSPITGTHAGGDGMSLAEICEAAVTVSDNTAANLMLAILGGPAGLTKYARSIGDTVTRLDRTEPTLNEAIPGDPRDTTSPVAMASNLRALATGKALTASSTELLMGWLIGCKTGDARLRAGLPHTWRVGDKTGTGERGTANDVAVAWPPDRKPIVISAYLTGSPAAADQLDATIAAVGRAIMASLPA